MAGRNQHTFQEGKEKTGGRRKGVTNKVTKEQKEFFRAFLESPEYRESMKQRMLDGKAPHLETLAHHYALGKPPEAPEEESRRVPQFPILVLRGDPDDDPLAQRALEPPAPRKAIQGRAIRIDGDGKGREGGSGNGPPPDEDEMVEFRE